MTVIVTGMGVISAIGNNVHENHRALQLMQTGIQPSETYLFNTGASCFSWRSQFIE